MIPARAALERLREGNRRFVSDDQASQALASGARRNELAAGQAPFAIILGCSDSRVPAELVFDQGLGDLFVIRVAGNIVASSQVGRKFSHHGRVRAVSWKNLKLILCWAFNLVGLSIHLPKLCMFIVHLQNGLPFRMEFRIAKS